MVQPNSDPRSVDLTVTERGGTYYIEVFSGPFKGEVIKKYGSNQIADAVNGLRKEGYNVRMSIQLKNELAGLPSTPTAPSTTFSAPTRIGTDPAFRSYQGAGAAAPTITPETSGFREPKLSDSTYDLIDETTGKVIGRNVALFNSHYQEYLDYTAGIGGVGGVGGTGATGPTAAELAIMQEQLEIERSKVEVSRSQVKADNLATFISGTIAELEAEIDAGRLETEQAIGEFNRRLDAFAEAGEQFREIQPYTIPKGAEYAPGFQPGGIGEKLGIAPRRAQVVQFDPFTMATDIVSQTPVLTDIGVPSGDALEEAVKLAKGFL